MHLIVFARHSRSIRILALAICVGFFVILGLAAATPATAAVKKAPTPPYRTTVGNRSLNFLQLEPSKTLTFSIEVTNTGTKVWRAKGTNLVALNAVKKTKTGLDINRGTKFYDKSWGTIVRPVGLNKDLKPGEKTTLKFILKAPKTVGEYREWFSLAVKGVDFMPGAAFELLVRVGNPKTAAYRVDAGLASSTSFTMEPSRAKGFEITVQNTGSATWNRKGVGEVVLALAEPQQRTSVLWHQNWYGKTILGRLRTDQVKPGQKGTFWFALQAPKEYGEYIEKVQVIAPGLTRAVDGLLTITVVVPSPSPVQVSTNSLGAEPIIRVGLVTTSDGWVEVVGDKPVLVTDANGALVAEVAASAITRLAFFNSAYAVTANGVTVPAPGPLRVTGKEVGTILTVTSWKSQYNKFRGTLELRSTPATKKVWLINDLPLEQYVSGLGETGNTGPTEFLKTMAVAARSYALFHNLRKTKHADEFYDINATTDQIYLGYAYELKVPNLVAAVVATRGVVITHPTPVTAKNTVGAIVAAYSSCTDGRTRSIKEVWNLDIEYFPYLVSVPDPTGVCTSPPYPTSYLTGGGGNHMVGMSAFGAVKYARDQAKTFDWILAYYYTGIILKQVYP
ncbi:MAG: SpoIID/LytB domain-containing protein [bacterium]|nr:SpoIID/LytB domain-containing protein [bacterium]